MRLDGPESGNVEYDSGRGGGIGGGMSGGLFGLIFQLVASRFGIIGMVVLALGYCALQSLGGGLGSGVSSTATGSTGHIAVDPTTDKFVRRVLGSTEQVWGQIFQQAGAHYTPTTLHFYSSQAESGCGFAQSAMGPFYCPTDKKIYLDAEFFNELSQRFQAPGDFAQAYVVAHEVGHHVQDLEGTLGQVQAAQGSAGEVGGNQMQIGIELQADCYAGVWAKRSGALEAGDIQEGMRAAEAIGDDTLQKETQGRVTPDSFTHGTSAQRMEALQRGLANGDPTQCNYTK
ncbi:MAG: neutral zinc metallopeptidase [Sphingomicrobium sp.]